MRVLFTQPYVPHYRVPLFDELDARLRESGHSLIVASSVPRGSQALRRDNGTGAWSTIVPEFSVATPTGLLRYRRGLAGLIRTSDICVMELDVGNLNAWSAAVRRRRRPLILWGHGKSFTGPSDPASQRLKAVLAHHATHIMTYSESGRRHLVTLGVPADRVTAVGNSTDTHTLRRLSAARRTRPLDRSEAFDGLLLRDRVVAAYVGGLDGDKRIPFLLEAADAAHTVDPRFMLLVAGSGSDEDLVRRAVAGGHVAWIPRADAAALVDIALVSRTIWMPGRVGLIAVDAMALGVPIVTTPFPYHAPEFEFLTPGRDVHLLPDTPAEFAKAALLIAALPHTCASVADLPAISAVADSMCQVIDTCLSSRQPPARALLRR